MMRQRESHRQWSRLGKAFLLATMLGWVLAPVLHAQFEVISTASAVESGHTDDCVRIHADSICLSGSTFHFLAARAAPSHTLALAQLRSPRHAAADRIVGSASRRPPSVRAPPTS